MGTTATLILGLITELPTFIPQIESLYEAAKSTFSASDQTAIEAALANAKATDAAATAAADEALAAAENA